jgi:hypothetical protein
MAHVSRNHSGPGWRICRASAAWVAAAWLLGACSAQAQALPSPSLSLDLPYGGCRLTVSRDGSAVLAFGAAPRWISVAKGTFNFDELVHLLEVKSSGPDKVSSRHEALGSVSLPNGEPLRYVEDVALGRRLLERAWQARIEPSTAREREDHLWVSHICAFR